MVGRDDETQGPEEIRDSYYAALLQCFTPDAPVCDEQLFHGRGDQRTALLTCIQRPGAHAIVFGERGAGKTSLARIVRSQMSSKPGQLVLDATCEAGDTFVSVWRQLFALVKRTKILPGLGFAASSTRRVQTSLDLTLPESPTAADICTAVETTENHVVAFVDEFDVLAEPESIRFAGLIKLAADSRLSLTLVLIGAAESIATLLRTHDSVERCLQQIQMPRMSPEEMSAIFETGWREAGFEYESEALEILSRLASGLPYYAHLLGQEAGFEAADNAQATITAAFARAAIRRACSKMKYTIAVSYREACELSDPAILDKLAALSPDNFGYLDPGADFDEAQIGRLCDRRVLTREYGSSRVRFRNPLLQPFVLLQRDLSDG